MSPQTKKSFLIIIAFFSFWSITMSGCKKDDDNTTSANVAEFSYKVDGVEFKSNASVSGYDTNSFRGNKFTTIVLLSNDSSKKAVINISGRMVGTYLVDTINYSGGSYVSDSLFFAKSGKIVISKYDVINKKVSGTFAFEVEEFFFIGTPKIKKITEGKFTNIPYTQLPS